MKTTKICGTTVTLGGNELVCVKSPHAVESAEKAATAKVPAAQRHVFFHVSGEAR